MITDDEYRFKIKFQGFDTEIRTNLLFKEFVLIVTDEIAQHYGFLTADELLASDDHLDAILMMREERANYLGGIYSDYKLMCKSLTMVENNLG